MRTGVMGASCWNRFCRGKRRRVLRRQQQCGPCIISLRRLRGSDPENEAMYVRLVEQQEDRSHNNQVQGRTRLATCPRDACQFILLTDHDCSKICLDSHGCSTSALQPIGLQFASLSHSTDMQSVRS